MSQLCGARRHLCPLDAIEIHSPRNRPSMATFDDIVPAPNTIPTSRNTSRLDVARIRQSILSRHASLSGGPGPSPRASREASDSPRLTRTSWEADRGSKRVSMLWRKPSSAKVPRAAQHGLKKFPREVYDGIVEQLKLLHHAEEEYCPSCYLKDLCSLSMTSRAWYRTASHQMYRTIWVPGHSHDASPQPGPRIPTTDRITLLRRTLRSRPGLAKLVRELHMPEIQAIYCNATIERENIASLVASLIMACPELERLVGFHVPYTHAFDRLSHALSTRTRLKERVWVMIDGVEEEEEDGDDDDPTKKYYHAARDPTERFLELNSAHQGLATLVLHQEEAKPKIDLTYRAIMGALWRFPFLRHLSLSGLTSTSFSNLALNALPHHLHSLRLENLAGINDKGLQRLASSHIVPSLRSLTLIDLEISQLATIAGFLNSHLSSLERFSLCQHETPLLRSGTKSPVFQSQTLSYIHWELRSQSCPPPTPSTPLGAKCPPSWPLRNDPEPESCLATRLLAVSISDGLFPSLRRIRAPHDPQGHLQAVCKPLAWASPSEKTERFYRPGLTRARSSQSSSTTVKSLLAAQSRIAAARKVPYLVVRVVDPQHNVQLESTMGRFLGELQSGITYDLKPDREREGAGDAEGVYAWMTGVDDVMGEWDGGGEGEGGEEGCGHGVGRRTRAGGVEAKELF